MVLAFLILAWLVLLVVGYVCTRDLARQFIKINNCARSSAYRKALLNSLLKLITVLGVARTKGTAEQLIKINNCARK